MKIKIFALFLFMFSLLFLLIFKISSVYALNNPSFSEDEFKAFLTKYENQNDPIKKAKNSYFKTDFQTKEREALVFLELTEEYEDEQNQINLICKMVNPDISFKKGNIYYLNPFDDCWESESLEFTPEEFFSGFYDENLSDYGTLNSIYYGSFSNYNGFEQGERKYLDYLNEMTKDIFSVDKYVEKRGWFFIPKVDFTIKGLQNVSPKFPYSLSMSYDSNDQLPSEYSYNYGFTVEKFVMKPDKDYANITGETYVIDIDHPKSVEEIKKTIKAYDPTEGDISNKIKIVSTNYDPTKPLKVDNYNMVVSVSDEAGNTSTATYNIVVKDITKPTVTGKSINVSYKDTLTASKIRELFTYSDNYYKDNDLVLNIIQNDYENTEAFGKYKAKVGSYEVKARVTDASDNFNEASCFINVIDDVKPMIVVAPTFNSTTTDPITIEEIKKGIFVTDDVDTNVTYELKDLDNYEKNPRLVKNYNFKITTKDNSNNYNEVSFVVRVSDTDFPEISANASYLIVISVNEDLSREKIIEILTKANNLTSYEIKSIESDYFTDDSKNGSYNLKIKGINLETKEEFEINGELSLLPKLTNHKLDNNTNTNFLTNVWNNYKMDIIIILVSTTLIISLLGYILVKKMKKSI